MTASRAPRAAELGEELRRDLGLLDAIGIGFGAIVGAGISWSPASPPESPAQPFWSGLCWRGWPPRQTR